MNVGIVIPSNNKGGPQKLAAIVAYDLALAGHRVELFIPHIPYYFYFVLLRRDWKLWWRFVKKYICNYLEKPEFSYFDLCQHPSVRIRHCLRSPSAFSLKKIDKLLVFGIEQLYFIREKYHENKMTYYVLHLEEHNHGHPNELKAIRKEFKGSVVALSQFTKSELSEQGVSSRIVPAVIPHRIWERYGSTVNAFEEKRMDLMVCYSSSYDKGGDLCRKVLDELLELRSHLKYTIWHRGEPLVGKNARYLEPNTSDEKLFEAMSEHKMLLYPSRMEGFGMPPIEGMLVGCVPILDCKVGAAPMYAIDKENCIDINGLDSIEIARKIHKALKYKEELEKISICCQENLSDFSPVGYWKRILGEK